MVRPKSAGFHNTIAADPLGNCLDRRQLTPRLSLHACSLAFVAVLALASKLSATWAFQRSLGTLAELQEHGVCPGDVAAAVEHIDLEAQQERMTGLQHFFKNYSTGFVDPTTRVLAACVEQRRFKSVSTDDPACDIATRHSEESELQSNPTEVPLTVGVADGKMATASAGKEGQCLIVAEADGDPDFDTSVFTANSAGNQCDGEVDSEADGEGPACTNWGDLSFRPNSDPQGAPYFSQELFMALRFNAPSAIGVTQGLRDYWLDEQTADLATFVFTVDHMIGVYSLVDCKMFSTGSGVDEIGSTLVSNFPTWERVTSLHGSWTTYVLITIIIVHGIYCVAVEADNFREAKKYGRSYLKYFASVYNYADIGTVVAFCICAAYVAKQILALASFDDKLLQAAGAYSNDEPLRPDSHPFSSVFRTIWDMRDATLSVRIALNVYSLFLFVHVVQATRFHPTLAVLVRTLEVVSAPLVDFLLYFVLMVVGYGFMAYILFSYSLSSFDSVSNGIWAAFEMSFGLFDAAVFADVSAEASVTVAVRSSIAIIMFAVAIFAPNVLLGIIFAGFEEAVGQARAYKRSFLGELPLVCLMIVERSLMCCLRKRDKRMLRECMKSLEVPPPQQSDMSETVEGDWKYLAYVMDTAFGVLPEELFEELGPGEMLEKLNSVAEARDEHHTFSFEFVKYLVRRTRNYQGSVATRLAASLSQRARSVSDAARAGAGGLRRLSSLPRKRLISPSSSRGSASPGKQ